MLDNIWTLTGTVTYNDGSIENVYIIKDYSNVVRVQHGNWSPILSAILRSASATAFRQSMADVLGLTAATGASVLADETWATVTDVTWRFAAITTNSGVINVLGSNEDLGEISLSNDFETIVTALGTDTDFVSIGIQPT